MILDRIKNNGKIKNEYRPDFIQQKNKSPQNFWEKYKNLTFFAEK